MSSLGALDDVMDLDESMRDKSSAEKVINLKKRRTKEKERKILMLF
jgi:hypothetical protein